MTRLVLGINSHHGDAAAALVSEEGPLAAVAEERLNRIKHFGGFPTQAIAEVFRIAGVHPRDLSAIAIARSRRANALAKARFMAARPQDAITLAAERLRVHRGSATGVLEQVAQALGVPEADLPRRVLRVEHHIAHAASAFYWSPFERAGALTADGSGDFATALWASCEGTRIKALRRNHWPHSLGVFYTALCQFIGFDRYGEEFKVMGLAAYGKPRYLDLMRQLVSFSEARGIQLNLDYFCHQRRRTGEQITGGTVHSPTHFSHRLIDRLGPPRLRSAPLTEREQDIAASVQARYEEIFLQMVGSLQALTGMRHFVFAGGCLLNSVANGRMLEAGLADRVYFHPAATDDGTAMGAAHHVLHNQLNAPRCPPVCHAYLGASHPDVEIAAVLQTQSRPYEKLDEPALLDQAVKALGAGKIVGWFQGRAEWGPRALGNRSILCNPAWPGMKDQLNARIKNREPFRPFAPAVRIEDLGLVFEGTHEVPFMVIVYKVRQEWRAKLSAITHEDGTGRVQTVSEESNALYWKLIGAFKAATGIPVLLNTSFNENEPIVNTPAEALACFERTDMDCLALGPYWLTKEP